MRVSPCAWFANSLEEAEDLAIESAKVTHNHSEGIKGARATAAAIYLARSTNDKKPIKDYIELKYNYDLNRSIEKIRPYYRFNETCQGTVPEAIIAFLESDSFKDAIRNAISLGGDSGTLAAIAGSIAEAFYRVSSAITASAFYFLDDTLSSVINSWISKGLPIGAQAKKTTGKPKSF
jgi:ADP-ribosylglycohydrolase